MHKKQSPIWLVVFSILCICCLTGSTHKTETGSDPCIQHSIEDIISEYDLPGINLSIIYSNGQQENYSAGFADMASQTLLTADHVMFSGSIGKTYAATVIMQLVDEGKIFLDEKFIDHFQEVKWLYNLPNIEEMTLKMLLQHTSGLPRYVMKPEVWSALRKDPDKIWTYKDRMSYIFHDEPVHEAGKGWAYSDTNYILLGMLIEKITGRQYYDVVRERIFSKLNLTDTHPAVKRDLPDLPQAYSRLPEFFQIPEQVVTEGKYCFNPQLEWTGGGFACNTPDLARWARAYYSGTLFSDSLYSQVITPNKNGRMIQPGFSYGMGSFIFETAHGKAYGHTGFVPGFRSIFAHYSELDISMALQINADYIPENVMLIEYLNRVLDNKIPRPVSSGQGIL
jgi:D-alanyl-D-alanine carboxypeptidase